jgi:type I restriction enzyme S subunit
MTQKAAIPKIDIRPDHWRIVHAILQKYVPQYAVWAFGSRAKWTAKEYSDLDLAVITDKPLPLSVSADLSDDFSESDLPWKVDIVDWATTSESFRKVIERDKVVIKGTSLRSAEQGKRDWGMKSNQKNASAIFNTMGKLGDFVDFKNGKTSPDRLDSGSFSVFGSNGVIGRTDITNASEGTLVVGRVGSYCGSVHYSPNECWVTDNAIIGSAKNLEEARFWFYKLASLNLNSYRAGSGQPLLNQQILNSIDVSVPALENERHRIAKVLGSFDDKIGLNRRINQTLEAMAQAIFKSWFVDFDPVKAKIAAIEQGHDPLRAAMRVISGKTDAELDQMPREPYDQLAATAALFPEEMQESELGEIPKGWRTSILNDLIDLNPSEKLPKGSLAPYIDMASLSTSGSWSEPPVFRKFGSGTKFRNKDTLLARITPCLENGKTAFIQNLPEETIGWGSTEFIVMRSRNNFPPELVYTLARNENFRNFAIQNMTGTSGRQRTQTSVIASYILIDAGKAVQKEFGKLVSPMFGVVKEKSKESILLGEVRDTILPKLLSGELCI